MITTNHSYSELSKEYKPATMGDNKPCNLACCCSTCMYCWLPSDFEEHHWIAFCGRCRKEDAS